MKNYDWNQILKTIESNQKFLLSTHINPDGDGLGSGVALYHCLKNIGKEPVFINTCKIPEEYIYLNDDRIIQTYNSDEHDEVIKNIDIVIALDIGEYDRLGNISKIIKESELPVICIDHHPPHEHDFFLEVIDETASAVAYMIYTLIKEHFPEEINKKIAEGLYTGILTDTGCFKYSNTDPCTMEMAADLLKYGLVPEKIFKYVYENKRQEQVKILGYVLQNINYEFNGRLAWFSISQQNLDKAGATTEDIDGFTDFVRQIKGVEVAVMFLEMENIIRLNFRSRGKIIVNELAKNIGGGGHPLAAGASSELSLEETIEKILPKIRDLFRF